MGYYPGNCVVLGSEWPLGRNGPLTDPEVISLRIKPPNAAEYTLTLGAGITKLADGTFEAAVDLADDVNDPGWWRGEWIGTATDTSTQSKGRKAWKFHVEDVIDLT